MRVAVLRRGILDVADVAEPAPGPDQVLARVLACGVCGTDTSFVQHAAEVIETSRAGAALFADIDLERDVYLGHEVCAEVVALGPGVAGLRVGDRVVSPPFLRTPERAVQYVHSNEHHGGFGEMLLLSPEFAVRVPDGLDPERAALTEPLAVGRHAVARSGIVPGEAAIVLGSGAVGLAIVIALRARDITPVIVAEPSPIRRQLALSLGADVVVDPGVETAIECWRRVDGRQQPIFFEATGRRGIIDTALRDLPYQDVIGWREPGTARIVVPGACYEEDTFHPFLGVVKEVSLVFSRAYTRSEFADTLHDIADGNLLVDALATESIGLHDMRQAFSALAHPDTVPKLLVDPSR